MLIRSSINRTTQAQVLVAGNLQRVRVSQYGEYKRKLTHVEPILCGSFSRLLKGFVPRAEDLDNTVIRKVFISSGKGIVNGPRKHLEEEFRDRHPACLWNVNEKQILTEDHLTLPLKLRAQRNRSCGLGAPAGPLLLTGSDRGAPTRPAPRPPDQ